MSIGFPRIGAAVALIALLSSGAAVSEEITLQQAIDAALKNPTVAAARLNAQAQTHAARGARALTSPEITVAPTVIGEAGADSALFVSQPLEINGSRRVRGEIAAHSATSASYEAESTANLIVLQVKQAYWETVRARELVRLNQENVIDLETLRASVQKQLDVGAVPGTQVIKTDVELARARQELAVAQLELMQSEAQLKTLMNVPESTDITPADELEFREIPLDRDKLLAAAQNNRPELASARAELAAAQAQIRAARIQRTPDVAVQARRETFESDSDQGVAVAVTLPILDWGSAKAEQKRAEAAAQSQQQQLEAVRNDVALDVEQAIQGVQVTSQIVREYQGGILEQSERLAQLARTGYERGATSYLEVLEAQRTLRSTKTDYISALAKYAEAIARLEWATGCSLLTEVQ